MPLQRFICPDGQQIEIEKCLQPGGCRLKKRCSTLPKVFVQAKTMEKN